MAMTVGSADDDAEDQMNSTINTTPLVDVMLVLLIIFLITIPVVTQSIQLSLPKERTWSRRPSRRTSCIAVSKDGDIYWNMRKMRRRRRRWSTELKKMSVQGAAARSAHPRRPGGALRERRPHGRGLPARRHRQGRLHHRTAAARRQLTDDEETHHGNASGLR